MTAAYIRRGYPLPVYDDAVRRLKACGIERHKRALVPIARHAMDDHILREQSNTVRDQLHIVL